MWSLRLSQWEPMASHFLPELLAFRGRGNVMRRYGMRKAWLNLGPLLRGRGVVVGELTATHILGKSNYKHFPR